MAFLELAALDGPVDTACLEELIEEARRHPLAPRALRVEVAGQLPSERSASADLRIIVGHTRDLVARPAPSTPLRLEQARDTSGYARYAEAFRAFVAADARVGPELWLPDEATFRELVDGGHAYDAHVDGQWAGFIAARAETFIGNDGWIVHEELLDAPFRGRGLAPALQRALVERLHEGRPGLVHGTIHFKNAASLATAKRVGRIDVGGYFFLELT
ncbi:MAG: hypothetical protein IPI35_20425 [Deltaproteobacteria bacterium]|nr:hypothetical protein [Deltaproteobacteria bacterium]